jgi:hypothetical protein
MLSLFCQKETRALENWDEEEDKNWDEEKDEKDVEDKEKDVEDKEDKEEVIGDSELEYKGGVKRKRDRRKGSNTGSKRPKMLCGGEDDDNSVNVEEVEKALDAFHVGADLAEVVKAPNSLRTGADLAEVGNALDALHVGAGAAFARLVGDLLQMDCFLN